MADEKNSHGDDGLVLRDWNNNFPMSEDDDEERKGTKETLIEKDNNTAIASNQQKEAKASEAHVQQMATAFLLNDLENCTNVESAPEAITEDNNEKKQPSPKKSDSNVNMTNSMLKDSEDPTDVESVEGEKAETGTKKPFDSTLIAEKSENSFVNTNAGKSVPSNNTLENGAEGIGKSLTLPSRQASEIDNTAREDYKRTCSSLKVQGSIIRDWSKNSLNPSEGIHAVEEKQQNKEKVDSTRLVFNDGGLNTLEEARVQKKYENDNVSVSEMSELTFETFATVMKRAEKKNEPSSQKANEYLQLATSVLNGSPEDDTPAATDEKSGTNASDKKNTKAIMMKRMLAKSLIQVPLHKLKEFIHEKKRLFADNPLDENDDEEKKLDRSAALNITHESISSQYSETSSSSRSDNPALGHSKKNEQKKKLVVEHYLPKELWEKTVDTVKKEKKYKIPLTVIAVLGLLVSLVSIIAVTIESPGSFAAFLGFEYRLRRLIRQHSPSTYFYSRDTPARLALEWMLNATNSNNSTIAGTSMSDERLLQRFALVTLWFSTHGEEWDHRGNWLSLDEHECTWGDPSDMSGKDVHCNANDQIVAIDLDSDKLTGSLPLELGVLTALTKLSAYRNSLTGTLPSQLGQLTQLEELLLYENQLSGTIPPQLGSKLTKLYWLRLEQNRLTGKIPSTFEGRTSKYLSWLLLKDNQLSGVVPTQLASLPALSWLALNSNPNLHGNFPSGDWKSSDIFRIWLQDTNLRGSVPEELCNPRAQITVDNAMECSCCDTNTINF